MLQSRWRWRCSPDTSRGSGTSALACASTQWFFDSVSPSPAPSASDLTQVTQPEATPPLTQNTLPALFLSQSPRGRAVYLTANSPRAIHRAPPHPAPASTTCPADSVSETRFPRQAPRGREVNDKPRSRRRRKAQVDCGGQDAGSERQRRAPTPEVRPPALSPCLLSPFAPTSAVPLAAWRGWAPSRPLPLLPPLTHPASLCDAGRWDQRRPHRGRPSGTQPCLR